MKDDGWEQVRAGLALILWSRLASWDDARRTLVPADRQNFENSASEVHSEFGRVISWIVFSVGTEYFLKGVCLVRGLLSGKRVDVLRPPKRDEHVTSWVHLVCNDSREVKEKTVKFPTFGNLPIKELVKDLPDRDLADLVLAAFKLLSQSIRNRDAHRYARNVRAAHFRAVPDLFVPALNVLVRLLDPRDLQARCSGLGNPAGSALGNKTA